MRLLILILLYTQDYVNIQNVFLKRERSTISHFGRYAKRKKIYIYLFI